MKINENKLGFFFIIRVFEENVEGYMFGKISRRDWIL